MIPNNTNFGALLDMIIKRNRAKNGKRIFLAAYHRAPGRKFNLFLHDSIPNANSTLQQLNSTSTTDSTPCPLSIFLFLCFDSRPQLFIRLHWPAPNDRKTLWNFVHRLSEILKLCNGKFTGRKEHRPSFFAESIVFLSIWGPSINHSSPKWINIRKHKYESNLQIFLDFLDIPISILNFLLFFFFYFGFFEFHNSTP